MSSDSFDPTGHEQAHYNDQIEQVYYGALAKLAAFTVDATDTSAALKRPEATYIDLVPPDGFRTGTNELIDMNASRIVAERALEKLHLNTRGSKRLPIEESEDYRTSCWSGIISGTDGNSRRFYVVARENLGPHKDIGLSAYVVMQPPKAMANFGGPASSEAARHSKRHQTSLGRLLTGEFSQAPRRRVE